MSKVKLQNNKAQAASSTPPSKPLVPIVPSHTAPLFRGVDWFTFIVTTLVVMTGYWLTLSPDLGLEDSGELAVGSFYAGIPHPPGYPVWTIYTWLFTEILPFSNIAWRVAVSSAVAGALSCGLLAFLVSRGSSMMIEGIAELKDFNQKWENAICVVSGFVAGTLLGFNGFMWSQSVIVEVYSFCVLSLMGVLLYSLRWVYAPHQHRYLLLAFFLHGICFNNHQSLLVAVLGMEVLVLLVQPKLARELFFWNTMIYVAGWIVKPSVLWSNDPVFIIFNTVGIASSATWIWLAVKTKLEGIELGRNVVMVAAFGAVGLFFGAITNFVPQLGGSSGKVGMVGVLAVAAIVGFVALIRMTRQYSKEWLVTLGCGGSWLAGCSFYLYMPLAGMTNPPMQWGYPRTVEGFFHAFTRGQYEKIRPTSGSGEDAAAVIGSFITTYSKQMWMYMEGMYEEFNLVYLLIALVMFFFYRKMQARERAWVLGVGAIYLCLGPFLVLLLNPGLDRQSLSLNRVFFTASHVLVAMSVGYGLTLIAAYMATQYSRFRMACGIGGLVAAALALYSVVLQTESVFSTFSFEALQTAFNPGQYALPIFAGLVLLASTIVFLVGIALWRNRAPLALTLALFAIMPLYSVLSHWADNEQRGHMFGYWFGHDMFTPPFHDNDGKPIYPEMTRNAILYGGTDPGRFCPTYMIFCESFVPPEAKKNTDPDFDRRDVYIITQNALADGTYLNYIRAHYNRSAQKLRGLDTPFFQDLVRSRKEKDENWETNIVARMVSPLDTLFTGIGESIEKKRRVGSSYFTASDFVDLKSFAAKLRAQTNMVSGQLYGALTPETRTLLTGDDDKKLAAGLAEDLNPFLGKGLYDNKPLTNLVDQKWKANFALESIQNERRRVAQMQLGAAAMRQVDSLEAQARERIRQIDAELDKATAQVEAQLAANGVPVTPYLRAFIRQSPSDFSKIRLARLLLEQAYPELARSPGGVYPDREMYIASPADSQRCFDEYIRDAQRRAETGQLKPGEDVKIHDGKVQVSGQVAVMAINGLLTKVMFDANPDNEFFVEESFPLDWMYPHLTPFGVIMKINRQPLATLTEEIMAKDHDFWSQFSGRLIGTNVVTYDTPVSNIVEFVEKVYLRHDWSGLTPDQRKFVRDDQGQKAFSKLRSSIAGVYAWRVSPQCPPEYRPKTAEEYQRITKEADFALRQAFAFCPYSPEAVFRYVNLLLQFNRLDDALLVAQTCLKLDPFNASAEDLVRRLREFKNNSAQAEQARTTLQQREDAVRTNPSDFQAGFDLASTYMQMQQPDLADQTLDRMLTNPAADSTVVMSIFRAYVQMGKWNKIEATLEKMTNVMSGEPEVWFDLAAIKANTGKSAESINALGQALKLSAQRRATNPEARDLLEETRNDGRFNNVRSLPEFQKLVSTN